MLVLPPELGATTAADDCRAKVAAVVAVIAIECVAVALTAVPFRPSTWIEATPARLEVNVALAVPPATARVHTAAPEHSVQPPMVEEKRTLVCCGALTVNA